MPEESTFERVQDSLTAKTHGIPNYVFAGGLGLLVAWLLWRQRGSGSAGANTNGGAQMGQGGIATLATYPGMPTGASVSPGQGRGIDGGPLPGQPGAPDNPITFPGYHPPAAGCPPGGCPSCPLGGACNSAPPGSNGPSVGTPLPIPPPPAVGPPAGAASALLMVSPQSVQAGQDIAVSVQQVAGPLDEYEVATAVSDDAAPPPSGWSTRYHAYGHPPSGDWRQLSTTAYEGYSTPKFLHVVLNLKNAGVVSAGGSPNVMGFNPALHGVVTLLPRG